MNINLAFTPPSKPKARVKSLILVSTAQRRPWTKTAELPLHTTDKQLPL